jgi:hypothetical protein
MVLTGGNLVAAGRAVRSGPDVPSHAVVADGNVTAV